MNRTWVLENLERVAVRQSTRRGKGAVYSIDGHLCTPQVVSLLVDGTITRDFRGRLTTRPPAPEDRLS